jgi:hypothetical protein
MVAFVKGKIRHGLKQQKDRVGDTTVFLVMHLFVECTDTTNNFTASSVASFAIIKELNRRHGPDEEVLNTTAPQPPPDRLAAWSRRLSGT